MVCCSAGCTSCRHLLPHYRLEMTCITNKPRTWTGTHSLGQWSWSGARSWLWGHRSSPNIPMCRTLSQCRTSHSTHLRRYHSGPLVKCVSTSKTLFRATHSAWDSWLYHLVHGPRNPVILERGVEEARKVLHLTLLERSLGTAPPTSAPDPAPCESAGHEMGNASLLLYGIQAPNQVGMPVDVLQAWSQEQRGQCWTLRRL